MAMMGFDNKTLERFFRSYKWARNNSLQLFAVATEQKILDYSPTNNTRHAILHQFQCLATTTDAYYRRLTAHEDQRFGLLVQDGRVIKKADITLTDVSQLLAEQRKQLEELLKTYDDATFLNRVQDIQSIINHEYLHQGQLIVLFRESSAAFPERFKKAFAL